jgi:ribosomal protein L22
MGVERRKESGQTPAGGSKDQTPEKEKAAAKKTSDKEPTAAKASSAAKESGAARKPAAKGQTRTRQPRKRAPKAAGEAKAAPAEKAPAPKKPSTPARPRRRSREQPEETPRRAPVRPVVRARAKYVRSSARKARLVIEHIRGKSIEDARAVLRHTPRGVARDVEKLLNSAVANAENNHELVGDDLVVKEVYADEGPTIKRFRPRAQGRATRIRKRTSHLTLTLTPKE